MATYRSNGFTAFPKNPLYSGGKKLRTVFFEKTITAAAAVDGDLYILAGAMSVSDKVAAIRGATPALTSATDNDLGFYKRNEDGTFTALDADILWDGVTLASALTYRELLGTLNTSLDRTKNIGQLLGLNAGTEPVGGVYLGLLIKTKSTATSEVLKLEVVLEEATTL
jgi:hypothetical protein